ncbi:MAG: hypothetical protein QM504_11240 [Pseudomonadota bacterium]
MTDLELESKTVKRFKTELIKTIPFFPNNKDTQKELLAQSITSILFHYIHWASRFIPTRCRKNIIDPNVTSDPRWRRLKKQINYLLTKVRVGDDLTPYLSLKAHKKGYTPKERIVSGEADSLDDKDHLLNIMGFHHFHLGENINDKGIADRTDEVLFVNVTRDRFHVIAIFDHSVFDSSLNENNELNTERARLWKIADEYHSRGLPPGTVYTQGVITASGHPIHIHSITNEYSHVIDQLDSKLSDREFENAIYEETKLVKPNNNRLNWHINGLDLGILDKANQFFILRYGPT